MNLQDRLIETQQKFDAKKAERQEQLTIIDDAQVKAENLLAEMHRLQGEYRLLEEQLANETNDIVNGKVNKEATAIEAVPEEKK